MGGRRRLGGADNGSGMPCGLLRPLYVNSRLFERNFEAMLGCEVAGGAHRHKFRASGRLSDSDRSA
jgi:hypothetical protein